MAGCLLQDIDSYKWLCPTARNFGCLITYCNRIAQVECYVTQYSRGKYEEYVTFELCSGCGPYLS